MLLHLQSDGATPLYEQLVAQVVYAVAAGNTPAGATLPSIRDVAKQVLVNPNTVARAYQELERQGVLVARRGLGMEVAPDAPRRCQELRASLVRAQLGAAVREAARSGLPVDDIRHLVDEELRALNHRPHAKEKR